MSLATLPKPYRFRHWHQARAALSLWIERIRSERSPPLIPKSRAAPLGLSRSDHFRWLKRYRKSDIIGERSFADAPSSAMKSRCNLPILCCLMFQDAMHL